MTPAEAIRALKLLSEAAQSSASYVPQFAASFISRVREELPEIVDGLEGETGAQVMTSTISAKHRAGASMTTHGGREMAITTPICYARPDRYEPHTQRCAVCRLSWDIDDPEAPQCPRQVATRAHDESIERSNRYVSALAPPYVDDLHKL